MGEGDVADTEQNYQMCMAFCGECPSYPEVEGEALYCARGPSDEEIDREGCKCKECPVWVKYGLKNEYYCDSE